MKKPTFLYRMIRGLARLLFLLFYRVEEHFLEPPVEGGGILSGNHTSFFDPPVIAATWPQEVHFLASDYLFKVPLLGALIRRLNAHPVSRGTGDLGAFRLSCSLLKQGKKIVVFPEGTRSHKEELMEFKRGIAKMAAITGAAIIPIYIQGAYSVWGRHRKWPKLWGRIRVFYGRALYAGDYAATKEGEEQLTADLKRAIENLRPR